MLYSDVANDRAEDPMHICNFKLHHTLPIYVYHPTEGIFANSVDTDRMPQNVASDQCLHCLL